eukprot:GHVU01233154.1.p1 GENE.GHVU01233154.1~~GHVU01233154.1.p1  ORF type:complete len:110 (+),score=2.83 GHVU01233154.1:181-510(+)
MQHIPTKQDKREQKQRRYHQHQQRYTRASVDGEWMCAMPRSCARSPCSDMCAWHHPRLRAVMHPGLHACRAAPAAASEMAATKRGIDGMHVGVRRTYAHMTAHAGQPGG